MKTSCLGTLSFFTVVALAACDGGPSFPDATTDVAAQSDTMSADVSASDVTDTGAVTDSGNSMDASDAADASTDAETDSGTTVDSGGATDSGTDTDSGSTCPPTGTGASCDDATPCVGGFTCDLGRCIPQGRATCGGFANTPCREAPYTVCLFETGHGDVGTCFSSAERGCLCAVAADQWSCH